VSGGLASDPIQAGLRGRLDTVEGDRQQASSLEMMAGAGHILDLSSEAFALRDNRDGPHRL